MGMWIFCCRKAHTPPKNRRLIYRNPVQLGPEVVQVEPATCSIDAVAATGRDCRVSNFSRGRKKLKKENSRRFSSSSRIRITCRVPPLKSSHYITTLQSKKENQDCAQKSQTAKNPTLIPNLRTRVIHKSVETRGLLPKLQKIFAHELIRCSSHIRKEEQHARETEIKQMAAHTSKRSMAISDSFSHQPRRKKAVRLGTKDLENTLETCLALNSSPRSSFEYPSENATTYVLSTLDVLSARPTIKYTSIPRYVPHTPAICLQHVDQKRIQKTLADEILKTGKRVDDLADRFSACELRELMERDRKRREKRKVADEMRIEKRLIKQNEIQDDEHLASSVHEVSDKHGVSDMRRNSLMVAPYHDAEGKVETQSMRGGKEPNLFETKSVNNRPSTPINDDISVTPGPDKVIKTVVSEPLKPVTEIDLTTNNKKTNISQILTMRKSTASTSPMLPKESTNELDEPNIIPRSQYCTSLFKLRNNRKKKLTSPALARGFKLSRKQKSAGYTPIRSLSTKHLADAISKFREDLKDLSQSSPSLKIKSPDLPERTLDSEQHDFITEDTQNYYSDASTSVREPLDIIQRSKSPSKKLHIATSDISPENNALSQSLGSIDSEASWLSGGRSSKKFSIKGLPRPKTGSISPITKYQEVSRPRLEYEVGIDEDDYFSRMSPIDREQAQSPFFWGEDAVEASSEHTKWGAVDRQPYVVHRSPVEKRSNEVLFNDFECETSNPYSIVTTVEPEIQTHVTRNTSYPRSRRAATFDSGYSRYWASTDSESRSDFPSETSISRPQRSATLNSGYTYNRGREFKHWSFG